MVVNEVSDHAIALEDRLDKMGMDFRRLVTTEEHWRWRMSVSRTHL
jgi:hypothetical protein